MRHSPRPHSCLVHTTVMVLAQLIVGPAALPGQAAVSVGYTRQSLETAVGTRAVDGYSMDLGLRIARRVDLLLGYEQLHRGEDALARRREFWTIRTGIQVLAGRSRLLNLGLGVGAGLFGLDVDSEDHNGGGLTGFAQARLMIHPVPIVGVYLGGVAQAMGNVGPTGSGGTAYGLTFGVQLRSDGW